MWAACGLHFTTHLPLLWAWAPNYYGSDILWKEATIKTWTLSFRYRRSKSHEHHWANSHVASLCQHLTRLVIGCQTQRYTNHLCKFAVGLQRFSRTRAHVPVGCWDHERLENVFRLQNCGSIVSGWMRQNAKHGHTKIPATTGTTTHLIERLMHEMKQRAESGSVSNCKKNRPRPSSSQRSLPSNVTETSLWISIKFHCIQVMTGNLTDNVNKH